VKVKKARVSASPLDGPGVEKVVMVKKKEW
jgi:hypothetical protein